MFTGIIERVAAVTRLLPVSDGHPANGARLHIATGFDDLQLGESISVNGACLTVTDFSSEGEAVFFLSPETLRKSALGDLHEGRWVNLERALQAGGRLSGHLVQGHVDGTGRLESLLPDGESRQLIFALPKEVARYTVTKGSIAIDGVSLTVNALEPGEDGSAHASIQIIPHTWAHTALGELQPGSRVNLEADVIGKYVAKHVEQLCQPYSKQ